MKPFWSLLLAVGWLAAGCSEKSPPPAGAPATAAGQAPGGGGSSGNPLSAPADYVGAVVNARNSAAKTVDLLNLRQAIQAFQAGEERLPASLQELVTEGYLPRLPAPPAGMQFAYNAQAGQVTLAPAK